MLITTKANHKTMQIHNSFVMAHSHWARDRDRDRERMGFYIMLYTVHTTQGHNSRIKSTRIIYLSPNTSTTTSSFSENLNRLGYRANFIDLRTQYIPRYLSHSILHHWLRLQYRVASDMLWRKNLIETHSQASLNTSCIANMFNLIELGSIAMLCGGQ